MTIHASHPFPDAPDLLRRARGRLVAPVTLWAAGSGSGRVGATVSSTQLVRGGAGLVTGVLDPLASIVEGIERHGSWTVSVLSPVHRKIAEAFGGYGPVPGGPFGVGEWLQHEWGPVEASAATWCGVVLDDLRPLGESLLVIGRIAHLEVGDDEPLTHWRGRFGTWTPLGA